jgi:hypothetical protein
MLQVRSTVQIPVVRPHEVSALGVNLNRLQLTTVENGKVAGISR